MLRSMPHSIAVMVCLWSFAGSAMGDDPPRGTALPPELLTKAESLIKGWDRVAPRISFKEKWRVALPIDSFATVEWASESDRLAVMTTEQHVLVLDASDGHELARFQGSADDRDDTRGKAKGSPRCFAITPDGKHVAIGCHQGVIIWDWEKDQVAFVHELPDGDVKSIRISRDGQKLACSDGNRTVHWFPIFGGMGRTIKFLVAPGVYASDLSLSADGSRLVFRPTQARPFVEYEFFADEEPKNVPLGLGVSPEEMFCVAAGKNVRVAGAARGRLWIQPVVSADQIRPAIATTMDLPIPRLQRIWLSRDERSCFGTNTSGNVVIAGTDQLDGFWLGYIPQARVRAVQGELKSVIATSLAPGEPFLVRHDLDPLAKHPYREVSRWIGDAFARKAFDEIDAVFEKALGSPAFAFAPFQTKYDTLLRAVIGPPRSEAMEQGRSEWLARESKRIGAKMVGADLMTARAWAARGSGMADTVSPEGWTEFHDQMLQAQNLLEPIFDAEEPPPLEFHETWFEVGKGMSWPVNLVKVRAKRFLERLDRWNPALDEIAVVLLPRWQGELTDAQSFAAEVRDKFGGDAGKTAYARIAVMLYHYHGSGVWATNEQEGLGFDYATTSEGLQFALRNEPCPVPFVRVCGDIARRQIDDSLMKAVIERRDRELRGGL